MRQAVSKFLRPVIFALLCYTAISNEHTLAQNENVELDTSLREISIGSDFRGADIVIFGAVDDSKQEHAGSQYYDIVIVIRGPLETVITRRKENYLGIWVNGESRKFENVPAFMGCSRPSRWTRLPIPPFSVVFISNSIPHPSIKSRLHQTNLRKR